MWTALIVDDQRMMAECLSIWLSRKFRIRVAGIAENGPEALRLAKDCPPDLVLLDITLPGMDGLELVAPLRRLSPGVRILVCSAHTDPYAIHRVLRSPVDGFVDKPAPSCVLQTAVRVVLDGGMYYSPAFLAVKRQALDSPDAFNKVLSEREQTILRFMSAGLKDADIAIRCSISVHTVETHRKRMRIKLDVHSDRELLAFAAQWGIRPLAGPDASGTPAPGS